MISEIFILFFKASLTIRHTATVSQKKSGTSKKIQWDFQISRVGSLDFLDLKVNGSPVKQCHTQEHKQLSLQRFLEVFSGAEFRPHSQWNLGDFFSNFEKKQHIFKKSFCCWRFGFSFSHHTHIILSYMVMFSFNLMAIYNWQKMT